MTYSQHGLDGEYELRIGGQVQIAGHPTVAIWASDPPGTLRLSTPGTDGWWAVRPEPSTGRVQDWAVIPDAGLDVRWVGDLSNVLLVVREHRHCWQPLSDPATMQCALPAGHTPPCDGADMTGSVCQPPPIPSDRPAIQDLVIADMVERKALGLQRYGTLLQAHNGRRALVDAYQEALDLAQYLRQEVEERVLIDAIVDAAIAWHFTSATTGRDVAANNNRALAVLATAVDALIETRNEVAG